MRDAVAIIGMACVFPKAPNVRAFWENILGKVDAIGDPPPNWGAETVYDPTSSANDRIYCKRGGYLGDLARFNPLAYGVMPRAVDGGEPEHFLALQVAHEALADAGYLERAFPRERTEVVLGRGTYVNRGITSVYQHALAVNQTIEVLRTLLPDYPAERLEALKRDLKAQLPPFNSETAPSLAHSVMCGRIANRLDLMGAAYTVDAACSSSLIAVEQGMTDLLNGKCDLVLAGGVQISTTFPITMVFCQLGALSRKGQSAPFSPEADGILLGEGIGMVVLKRRQDAERDGDRIYAAIKAVGVASDGRAMGVLAPRLEGEVLAMRRAYEAAGIAPDTIGLVEAHGTGTAVGDATELDALSRIFGTRTGQVPTCALGSVKSMIGHCIPAAGVAGLIKAALALYHKVLPPTLHATRNPKLAESPLFLNSETRPWVHGAAAPRRAAVSAFGFGGINTHAILEEVPPTVPVTNLHARRDSELLLVAAPSREALAAKVAQLRRYLAANPTIALDALAWTLNCPAPDREMLRLAVVAETVAELDRKLAFALERLADPACRRIREVSGIYFFETRLADTGTLAFLFPGEGAQYAGMLMDLSLHFPEVRAWFDLMDRAFQDHPRGFLPSQVVFPRPNGTDQHGSLADRLWEMDSAIESVFTANQAIHALLAAVGIRPAAVVGHSTGEYSALLVGGAVRVADEGALIRYIQEGNRVTERALQSDLVPAGQLLTVGPAERTVLDEIVRQADGSLFLAMDNCPHQIVLAGDERAITRVQADLRTRGAICQLLPFRRAYHTPLFSPVGEKLREYFHTVEFRPPQIPVYSCATAAPLPADPDAAREIAVAQWSRPVRFRETIEAMYADGVRLFVEAGPRGNLTAFVDDILRGRPYLAVAANLPRRSGVTQLHHVLGLLAAHGVPVQLDPLYLRRNVERLDAAGVWSGRAVPASQQASMPLAMGLPILRLTPEAAAALRPAVSPPAHPAPTASPADGPASGAGGPAAIRTARAARRPDARGAMVEYLRTMETFLTTQEAVLRAATSGRSVWGGNPTAGDRPGASAESGGGCRAAAPVAEHLAARALPTPHPAAVAAPGPAQHDLRQLPFVDRILREVPGAEVIVQRTLDLSEDRFLGDHTLGPTISDADPTLLPLPILPLALTIEMMAEAAALLVPTTPVRAVRQVRALRWIAVPEASLTLEIHARRHAAVPMDVAVEIREVPRAGNLAPGALCAQAVVCFGGAPDGPDERLQAGIVRPPTWPPAALYAAGARHGMFHGPQFQGVAAMTGVGTTGAEAVLRALPGDRCFRSKPSEFLTDPFLVDAAGQVVGFWAADCLQSGFVIFPIGCEELSVSPSAPSGRGPIACTVRLRDVAPDSIRSDVEARGEDGRLLLRAIGWEDRRFALPENLYAFRLNPKDTAASRLAPEAVPAGAREAVRACLLEVPAAVLEADARIWRESLAHLALSRQERVHWARLSGPERRRTEWLLGRVVAKDAIRTWAKDCHGLRLFPADVEIVPGEFGAPGVQGGWVDGLGAPPALSLAHSDGIAVALAGGSARDCGLGIDLESLGRARPGYEAVAFSAEEQAYVRALDAAVQPEWFLRLWCAKEAVAKALGRGMLGSPRHLVVQGILPDSGEVRVALAGELAEAFPAFRATDVPVHTVRMGERVLACAIVNR
jgi:acyl transferase domain-containing protein/phosphopantetheinyl transferase